MGLFLYMIIKKVLIVLGCYQSILIRNNLFFWGKLLLQKDINKYSIYLTKTAKP